jgi:hypothetical protein
MVVEVSCVEWTPDGLFWHVVYLGERDDKPPSQVMRRGPDFDCQNSRFGTIEPGR